MGAGETVSLYELCKEARGIVSLATERIEAIRAEHVAVDRKRDGSPVTRADREADQILQQGLMQLDAAGWLSEETADSPASESSE